MVSPEKRGFSEIKEQFSAYGFGTICRHGKQLSVTPPKTPDYDGKRRVKVSDNLNRLNLRTISDLYSEFWRRSCSLDKKPSPLEKIMLEVETAVMLSPERICAIMKLPQPSA